MDDLVTWLRQQLDDDERVAHAAADYGSEWRYSNGSIWPSDESRHPGAIATGTYGGLEDQHGEHMARHDPARALVELNAKRRILDEHQPDTAGTRTVCAVCADPPAYEATWRSWPCQTVRLLALPYATWPGYQPEWRPE